MKFLSRSRSLRGIAKMTFCCGLYTLIGITIFQAVSIKCSDDGITESRLRLNNETILDSFEPVGCFKDRPQEPRNLPKYIKNLSKLLNWKNWPNMSTNFNAIIRACAEMVNKQYDFRYFGIQYYYECWSGLNGDLTYNRSGQSTKCFGNFGVGVKWTNFVYRFVEVNGRWSNWSPWQPCSVTCGKGNRSRVRTCTDPVPKWEGQDCIGMNISSDDCNQRECKVNGRWSDWFPWQPCSVTCGNGSRSRVRTCTDPAPKWEGQDCIGMNISSDDCSLIKCKDPKENSYLQSSSKLSLLAPLLGSLCLVLLCLGGAAWFGLRYLRKRRSNSELIDQWEVIFDDISLCKIVGEGAFGKVYSGEFLKKTDATENRKMSTRLRKKETKEKKNGLKVAVKMLRNGATEEQKQEFLEEIELMKQIGYHRNILNLLACCTATVPMFLVVEFAKYGDLLHYLRQRREQIKQAAEMEDETHCRSIGYQNIEMINETNLYDCASNKNKCTVTSHRTVLNETGRHNALGTDTDSLHDDDKLTPADLLTFAWQIAKGMEFLSGKGFVHRDLAARNVLVCEGKLIKVADFGLSRYIYTEKVYHCKKARKLPIKWMSPEAIHDQVFTAESDVWAYGVLLWEVGTIGGTPYPTIANQRLLQALNSGYRMEKPQICSDEMYELMQQCWREKPAERPSFIFIREQLEQMMLRQCSYLDLNSANEYCHAPCCDNDSDEENTAL